METLDWVNYFHVVAMMSFPYSVVRAGCRSACCLL